MRGISPLSLVLRAFFGTLAVLCLSFGAANAAPPAVEKVRVQTHEDFTRVVLEVNAPIEPNLFTLGAPHRLVIDLPELQWLIPRPSGSVNSPLIRSFSFGLFQPGVSRLILDLSGPAQIVGRKLRRRGRGFVYEIDLTSRAGPQQVDPASASSQALSPRPDAVRFDIERLPTASTVDPATKDVFQARSFDPEKAEFEALGDIISAALADAKVEKSLDEALNEATEVAALTPDLAPTLAERAGLEVPEPEAPELPETLESEKLEFDQPKRPPLRIVLDPGHGGKDPGTGSGSGVKEKDINLAFAQVLAALLEDDPRYTVHLTRETDTRVPLPKRVLFARRKNADLFISIHADWSANAQAKGATAYTLSEKASVEALDDIATERGKVGRVAGVDLAAEREDVARLLVDLARRETQARSLKFAELVIAEVAKETTVLRRPLRRDSFHVLKAPDMPSVLLELGFVSNEDDRRLLQSPVWRLKTAGAVKKAIDAWRKATGARDFANR